MWPGTSLCGLETNHLVIIRISFFKKGKMPQATPPMRSVFLCVCFIKGFLGGSGRRSVQSRYLKKQRFWWPPVVFSRRCSDVQVYPRVCQCTVMSLSVAVRDAARHVQRWCRVLSVKLTWSFQPERKAEHCSSASECKYLTLLPFFFSPGK